MPADKSSKKHHWTREQTDIENNKCNHERENPSTPVEEYQKRNRLVQEFGRQEQPQLRAVWYSGFLPIYIGGTSGESYKLCQGIHPNHAHESLLFDKGTAWSKKNSDNRFDITMHGSFDGAEVRELVGLYILSILSRKYGKSQIGLYRDDGLAAFRSNSQTSTELGKKSPKFLKIKV